MESLREFDKKYGNRFYIPKNLKKALREIGIGDTEDLIRQLQLIHVLTIHNIYKKKCKIHAKEMRVGKIYKDLIVNGNKRLINKIKEKYKNIRSRENEEEEVEGGG